MEVTFNPVSSPSPRPRSFSLFLYSRVSSPMLSMCIFPSPIYGRYLKSKRKRKYVSVFLFVFPFPFYRSLPPCPLTHLKGLYNFFIHFFLYLNSFLLSPFQCSEKYSSPCSFSIFFIPCFPPCPLILRLLLSPPPLFHSLVCPLGLMVSRALRG